MNYRFARSSEVDEPLTISTASLDLEFPSSDTLYVTTDASVADALRQVPSLQELEPEETEEKSAPVDEADELDTFDVGGTDVVAPDDPSATDDAVEDDAAEEGDE